MCLIDKYVLFVYITHVFNRQVCFICTYNPCVKEQVCFICIYITHVFNRQVCFICTYNPCVQ